METKYTKGDWNLEENVSHYPMIMNDDGNVIASLFDTKDGQPFYGIPLPEVDANAKLIAQSPAMLSELQKIVNFMYANKDIVVIKKLITDLNLKQTKSIIKKAIK